MKARWLFASAARCGVRGVTDRERAAIGLNQARDLERADIARAVGRIEAGQEHLAKEMDRRITSLETEMRSIHNDMRNQNGLIEKNHDEWQKMKAGKDVLMWGVSVLGIVGVVASGLWGAILDLFGKPPK